jgi:hypothetical protein
MPYTWVRFSKGHGYEVSTKGDKRFSALVAKLKDGRTIEMHWQCDTKFYNPGGTNWWIGKGKPPLKFIDSWVEYLNLWREWVKLNPELFNELKELADKHEGILKDCHASTFNNQANALSTLLNEHFPS